ncbi:MAG: sialate O-acetylesterase [Bacteroidales bacterium]
MARTRRLFLILLCAGFFAVPVFPGTQPLGTQPPAARLRLPALIGDGMVLQRDEPLRIWGWAAPGQEVRVDFLSRRYRARTGSDGRWEVGLPPLAPGGPHVMRIEADTVVEIQNILVGDVWLCAGQSNMVHDFIRHRDRYAGAIAASTNPRIRQFRVPDRAGFLDRADDVLPAAWKEANPENLMTFSVVGYFFARALHERYGVPVGFINASVGGTPIEAWTSEEGLAPFPDILDLLRANRDTASLFAFNRRADSLRADWWSRVPADRGRTGTEPWQGRVPDSEHWLPIRVPGYWEDQGVKDLDGVVWYRREIQVPASMTSVPSVLHLGRIVDADEVYLNGAEVGRTTYQYPQRRYELPAGILQPGRNLLVVRVTNQAGKGGFVPDKPCHLCTEKDTLDLGGTWLYRVGSVFPDDGDLPRPVTLNYQPAVLFNGMVAPLTSFAVKGVCWYQGESDTDDPAGYADRLKAFVTDWRTQWGRDDLPFLCVQLPNYLDVNYSPEESTWALLRESQARVLDLPRTGLVVTLGLGEWNDIHPGNKQPVGERLALAAGAVAYGETDRVSSGPLFESARAEGNRIVVRFRCTGSGLTTSDGEAPAHLAVAGSDRVFRWAEARIDGDELVVWHKDIPRPLYVRYAWADNPRFANLCNREGLPAAPFRTDL